MYGNNEYPTYQNNSYPSQPQPPPSSQFTMSSQSWFDPPTPSSHYNAPPPPTPQYNAPPPQSYPSQFNQPFQQYPSQFNSPMPPAPYNQSSYNQFNQQNLNSNQNYPSSVTTLPTAPSLSNGLFPTLPNSVHPDQFMPQSKPTTNLQIIVR